MPAEGVKLTPRASLLTRAELGRVVRVLAACGVTRLRLTGGEPTLRPDLAEIVRESPGPSSSRHRTRSYETSLSYHQ